ncbi:glycolate oxidase subunit GlcF [Methylibium petroleiphilum]|uniref:glycolate oxidase subunit GlcF n=1 Tax=Methylibium petroleiphilum TaxID=105560 RepID=UPI001AC32B90|nr:glycolate oxidase subunit GlcF [Methylibium petroleiphilum]MBN9205752.1 glycolate oxidase subunit GlcF [Methylibium petroleiphilum]
MQTTLAPEYQGSADGADAEAILRKCVHCGFCTATCPTYQLLGDELDGPRGRIYLIKQVLEGAEPTRKTQLHLDRCLTCRNCESTCPSGVQYGALVDIGRRVVDAKVERPAGERAARTALKEGLTSPLFAPAMKLGQLFRPLVPAALKAKVPSKAPASAHRWPTRSHPRKVLMLLGCVQPAMAPNINSATARVLDAAGIQTLVADDAGCCGAIRDHLGDHEGGLADMRRNIDAWWPLVEGLTGQGAVEAIVMNASGCGVTVKDYARHLKHDSAYAERAARISALTRDLSELLPDLVPKLKPRLRGKAPKLAFHPPCTLQHGQQLRGGIEGGLRELGFDITLTPTDSHLCCGSAGTYSVLQPTLAYQLRDRKLAALAPVDAQAIVSANIGCIQHLQSGTPTPVKHWVEVLDEALA